MGCCFSKELNPNFVSERTGLLQSTVPEGSPLKEGTREHARAMAGLAEVKRENGNRLIPVDTTSSTADLATRLGPIEKCRSSVQKGTLLLTEPVECDSSVNKPRSLDEGGNAGSKDRYLERKTKDIRLVRPQIKPCTERVMSNSVKRKIAENAVMRANWFKEATSSESSYIPEISLKKLPGQSPSVATGMLNGGKVNSHDASVEPLEKDSPTKDVCVVTAEAFQKGIGKLADDSTVGPYISSQSKALQDLENCDSGDCGLDVYVALERGFKMRTQSFYSICSIDADDLEGDCGQDVVTHAHTATGMDKAPVTTTKEDVSPPTVIDCQFIASCPVKESVPLDCQQCPKVENSVPRYSESVPLQSVSHNDDPALPDLLQTFVSKESVCKPSVCEDTDPLPHQDTLTDVLTDQLEEKDGLALLPGKCPNGALVKVTDDATPDLLEGKGQLSSSELGGEESRPVAEHSRLHPVNPHPLNSVYGVSGYEHAQQPQHTPESNVQLDSVYTAHVSEAAQRDVCSEMLCHLKVMSELKDDVLEENSTCPDEVVDVSLKGSRLALHRDTTGASSECGEMPQMDSTTVSFPNKSELLCDDGFAGLNGVVLKADLQMSEIVSEMSVQQIENDSTNASSVEYMTKTPPLVVRQSLDEGADETSDHPAFEYFKEGPTNANLYTEQSETAHCQSAESESANDSLDLRDDAIEDVISFKLKQYDISESQCTSVAPEFFSECIDIDGSLSLGDPVNSQSLVCDLILESSPHDPIVTTESEETLDCIDTDNGIENVSPPYVPNSVEMKDAVGLSRAVSEETVVEEQHSEHCISVSTPGKCEDFGDTSYSTAYSPDSFPKAAPHHPITSVEKDQRSESSLLNDCSSQLEGMVSSEMDEPFIASAAEEKKSLVLEQVNHSYSVQSTDAAQLRNVCLINAEGPTILGNSLEDCSGNNQLSEQHKYMQPNYKCEPANTEESTEKDSSGILFVTPTSPCLESGEPVDLNPTHPSVLDLNIVASEQPQMLMLDNLMSEAISESMQRSHSGADDQDGTLDETPGSQCASAMPNMPELSVTTDRICLSEDCIQEDCFCLSSTRSPLSINMSNSLVEISQVPPCEMLNHQSLLGSGEGREVEDKHRTLPVSCKSQPLEYDEQWPAAVDENTTAESLRADPFQGSLLGMYNTSLDAYGGAMQPPFEVNRAWGQDLTTFGFSQPIVFNAEPDQVDVNATTPSYEIHMLNGEAFVVPPETSTDEMEGEQGMLNLVCNLLEKSDFNEDANPSQYLSMWPQESHATLCPSPIPGCVGETAWERGFADMPPGENGDEGCVGETPWEHGFADMPPGENGDEDASKDDLQSFQAFMAAHPYSLMALDGTCFWDWQSAFSELVSIVSKHWQIIMAFGYYVLITNKYGGGCIVSAFSGFTNARVMQFL